MSDDLLDVLTGGKERLSQPSRPVGRDPVDFAIRTVYGEADHDPASRQAVAGVIHNRSKAKAKGYDQVVLEPGQFEAWSDPKARARMEALDPNSPEYRQIASEIAPVLKGEVEVPYDHFYSPGILKGRGQSAPDWDDGSGQQVGTQLFFALGGNAGPDLGGILGGGDDKAADQAWAGFASGGTAPGAAPPSAGPAGPVVAAVPVRKDQGLGFMKGVMRPMDNAALWLETGLDKVGVPTEAINKMFGMPGTAELMQRREAILEQKAAQGIQPGGLGEIAGSVLGTIPAVFATRNPLILGGVGGALTTESPTDPGAVAMDAGVGAITGKLADVGINRLMGAIKPQLSGAVNKLLQEGVELTPGQTLGGVAKSVEDKLTSLPFLGDMIQGARARGLESFNVAALNRVLGPIGEALPKGTAPGFEAIEATAQKVSKAYDDLLTGVTIKADQPFASAMGNLVANARATLPEVRARQFEQIAHDVLTTKMTPAGTMSGASLKAAESRLGEFIRQYGGSADGDQRLLAESLKDMQSEFRDLVVRSNPAIAARLKEVNTAFANLVRVEKAASSVAAEHGVFTPAQLVNAVKASDRSSRKSASARGNALMQDFASAAKETLPSKVPDSGTPGRLLLNLLAGGGLTGGTIMGAVNPAHVALGLAAMAPYTRVGGKMVNKLITARPPGAQGVRDALGKLRLPAILAAGGAASTATAKPKEKSAARR